MKTILIQSDVRGAEEIRNYLKATFADFNVVTSITEVELSEIEVVIIWLNIPPFLKCLPNLKLILSCGSGVEHIIDSPYLSPSVPLVRLVDDYLINRASNYVVEQILEKYFPLINMVNIANDQPAIFKAISQNKIRVGIMGLGLIGSESAIKLKNLGFEVSGWVNTIKKRLIDDVYIGEAELGNFAKKCNVLVCQLPLTSETKGVLNIHLFNFLPDASFLINVGRGGHLVESDLILALENKKLSGACLDVLEVEPIPLNHPFNKYPNIKVTPHVAGYIGPDTQAPYASKVIKDFFNNDIIKGVVNYNTFY
jgi:glyoxylate/hydroxypyruvate reductase A